jgi:GMP synthase-like glutamine amidotransferase
MNAHFLQHVPFEGLGSIEAWLNTQKARLTSTRFFLNERLPDPSSLDFVISGPGPMSVNDETVFPWLEDEKRFLREAMDAGIPVLGICLGAQLIASSLGARIYPNPVKEIGWFPVQADPVSDGCFRFPNEFDVFHWHGETFDLPADAVRLVRSPGCANQGFQIGRKVIGLQFHLEANPHSAKKLIENSRDEMLPGPFVQSESAIAATPAEKYAANNYLMNEVLAYLVENS